MTIEEVIRKAIKAGYSYSDLPLVDVKETSGVCVELIWAGDQYSPNGLEHDLVWPQCIFLDPSFWQSLGKALGWGEITVYNVPSYMSVATASVNALEAQMNWKYHWRHLVDALAEGKTPEDYFADLPES